MARNRTAARLAVLGSVVQRPAAAPYSSRASSALRRRAAVVALVIVSLALITVYFRESGGGRLHGIQGVGSTVLQPFQVAADRVASPFRDAYGYFADLAHAKSDADRLRTENAQLRQRIAQNDLAVRQNAQLRSMVKYQGREPFPDGYRLVATEVTAQQPHQFDQQITIGAGVRNGVRQGQAVLSPEGFLVGTVTLAYSRAARVALLTDGTSAVSAIDPDTRARGIVRAVGDTLILDRVSKEDRIGVEDLIITSGFRWNDLESLYPAGIQIGFVESVSQVDTEFFKQVQLTPLADFSSLESVMVVVPREGDRARR